MWPTNVASPKRRNWNSASTWLVPSNRSPEHYREVVLLRDVEELTINEIAERLGRTREAVKGNLHRARLLLREYLQPENERCQ